MAKKTAPASRAKPGRGKSVSAESDLRQLARDAALAALNRLADLSRSEDERVALAATQELLNRAFGKAAMGGNEESPTTRPLVIKIVRFGQVDEKGEAQQ